MAPPPPVYVAPACYWTQGPPVWDGYQACGCQAPLQLRSADLVTIGADDWLEGGMRSVKSVCCGVWSHGISQLAQLVARHFTNREMLDLSSSFAISSAGF